MVFHLPLLGLSYQRPSRESSTPYLIDRPPKILGNRMDSEGVYASNGVKTKSDPEVALLSAVHPLN